MNALPGELKFQETEKSQIQEMYEHEHLPITLRYHENANKVYLEGNKLITFQYVRIMEMRGMEREKTGNGE